MAVYGPFGNTILFCSWNLEICTFVTWCVLPVDIQLDDLAHLNTGLKADELKAGQTILLPANKLSSRDKEILSGIGNKTYRVYPVRDGENLTDIISKRGITRAEMEALNPEVKLDKLPSTLPLPLPSIHQIFFQAFELCKIKGVWICLYVLLGWSIRCRAFLYVRVILRWNLRPRLWNHFQRMSLCWSPYHLCFSFRQRGPEAPPWKVHCARTRDAHWQWSSACGVLQDRRWPIERICWR